MDIREVDLNLLVVLDALLRLRNVSRAAESLDMSQPAVSYALAKLRTLLKDPLFIRAARAAPAPARRSAGTGLAGGPRPRQDRHPEAGELRPGDDAARVHVQHGG